MPITPATIYSAYRGGRYLYDRFTGDDDFQRQPMLPKDTSITRESKGSNINRAAEEAMSAETQNISRLLGVALRGRDVELAGSGMFTSGERIRQGDVLRGAASRDLANALARIGLQREGLRQEYRFGTSQLALQEAQMEEQARQANMALWASVISQLMSTGSDLYTTQQSQQQNALQSQQLNALLAGG